MAYQVLIQDRLGNRFSANLPDAFDSEETKIEPHEKGIRVTAPHQHPIYINGNTRQISRNPEVCRTDTILDPRFVNIGREEDKAMAKAAAKIFDKSAIRSLS